MSRKKINLDARFCGVHRAEWFRLASDVPTEYISSRCYGCVYVDCDKCEACVLRRVIRLALLRLSRLDVAPPSVEFVDDYPSNVSATT